MSFLLQAATKQLLLASPPEWHVLCLCLVELNAVQPNCRQTGRSVSRFRNVLAKCYLRIGLKSYSQTKLEAFPEPTQLSFCSISFSKDDKSKLPLPFSCLLVQALSTFAEICSFVERKLSAYKL